MTVACTGRFIAGAGAAFAAVNCLKLIANWFPVKQFAFMAGLMMTVGMLGAVGGQGPLSAFIRSLDWRTAMAIIAGAGLALALLFALVVKDRAPHHRKVDLLPRKTSVLKNLKSLLRNRQSWYLSLYSGFAFAPVSAFGGLWGVPYLTQAYGVTPETAAHGSSLIFLGFAVGSPLFGWYSDHIGKRRPVMFWGTLAALASLAAVIYIPNLPFSLIAILLFVFGCAISSFLLCFTMIKEIHYAGLAATSIGFMNAFDALFGAFSDPLTGKLLDMGWTGAMSDGARLFPLESYKWAFSILIAYLVLSLLFVKFIRETHCKQTYPSAMP
jgi:nitrate/nitrite transporter NarK